VVSDWFELRGDEADLAHIADGLMKRPNVVVYVDHREFQKDARCAGESLWAASKHFSFEPLCVNLDEIRAIGPYQIVERSALLQIPSWRKLSRDQWLKSVWASGLIELN